MRFLSATDAAIAQAIKDGTLKVTDECGRLGTYCAISDENGLIEVQITRAQADDRVETIRAMSEDRP